jgi:hypothetical protein
MAPRTPAEEQRVERTRNRRQEGRLFTSYDCVLAGIRQRASGRVADISHQGALIDGTQAIPVRGELVGLTFPHGEKPVLLIGWVTRHVEHGFAIEFDHLDERARGLIDDLAALVAVEHRRTKREADGG